MFDVIKRPKDYWEKKITHKIIELRKKILKDIESKFNDLKTYKMQHHVVYQCFFPKNILIEMEKYSIINRVLSTNAGQFFDSIIKDILINHNFGQPRYIDNPEPNAKPKKFEIDIMDSVKNTAYEIKWRDAGTDGDHVNKETRKQLVLKKMGFKTVRLTFFVPETPHTKQAHKNKIALYDKLYESDEAFNFIKEISGVDILKIFKTQQFDLSKEISYNMYRSEGNLSEFL